MYYRFFYDVLFSHNEANGPESTTMRLIRRVRQDGGTGGKVCPVRPRLVNFALALNLWSG